MQKTLPELQLLVESLGLSDKVIPTGRCNKVLKRDYIQVLGDYYQYEKYGNSIPFGLSFRRKLESPMLAYRYDKLKEEEQRNLFSSDQWGFEEKYDGVRMLFIYDGHGNCWAYSRNISEVNFLPIEYSDKLYHPHYDSLLTDHIKSILKQAETSRSLFSEVNSISEYTRIPLVIDCEVLCSSPDIYDALAHRQIPASTQLEATTSILSMNKEDSLEVQNKYPLIIVPFDIIHYNGEDLFEAPFFQRRELLSDLTKPIENKFLHLSELTFENKQDFLSTIIDRKGEGCIAKHLNSPYLTSTSRNRNYCVKIKRKVSDSIANDTVNIDAFITGFEVGNLGTNRENSVGTLIFSINLFDEEKNEEYIHEIAYISSFSDEDRKSMTTYDEDGNPTLKKEWYNKVYEIDGQDISSKSLRLSHARIIQSRADRDTFTCFMTKSDLLSMVM